MEDEVTAADCMCGCTCTFVLGAAEASLVDPGPECSISSCSRVASWLLLCPPPRFSNPHIDLHKQATSASRAAATKTNSPIPRRRYASEASAPMSSTTNSTQRFAASKSDFAPMSNSTTHLPADVVNTASPAILTGAAASNASVQPTTWWLILNVVLGTMCAVATVGLTIYRIRLARKRLHAARRTSTRSSLHTVALG